MSNSLGIAIKRQEIKMDTHSLVDDLDFGCSIFSKGSEIFFSVVAALVGSAGVGVITSVEVIVTKGIDCSAFIVSLVVKALISTGEADVPEVSIVNPVALTGIVIGALFPKLAAVGSVLVVMV